MAGYDPTAANEYNQLIQQGIDPEEAAQMAGIAPEDLGNYTEVNGQLTQNEGPPIDNTDVGPQTDYGTSYDEFGNTVTLGPPTQDTSVNPASDPNQFPAYDDDGNLLPGYAIDPEFGQAYYAGFTTTKDTPVNPASDPSQFPAYDDEGNLQPGFAVNPETGGTYYAGFTKTTGNSTTTTASTTSLGTTPPASPAPTPPTTSTTANVTTRSLGTTPPTPAAPTPPTQQTGVNDPYYGLTPQQITALGNADPTDPYIRARLGIPQLSTSPLAATPGFGNIKTGIPLVDSALSLLGGLFSTAGPATKQAAVPAQAATTGNGTPPVTVTALGPPTKDTGVNPASDPSQFPAYDDEGNLQPGFAINEETGGTYYTGISPPTQITEVNPYDPGTTFDVPVAKLPVDSGLTILSDEETNALFAGVDTNLVDAFGSPLATTALVPLTDAETAALFAKAEASAVAPNNTTLTASQSDAYYSGTGALTADQQYELDKQTARDAAILYPGTNNEALRQIDIGAGRIAANEVGITRAENIIAANNAELADPYISDARRAELEANNESQYEYIQVATENSIIQQNVIEQNAEVFAAGGGNPGDGQTPTEVNASEDPTIQVANNATLSPPVDETLTILSDEETNALFDGADPNLVDTLVPPATAPVLLTDEQINAIYPLTDPKETGALFGTTIISDEARAALSDPAAIAEQLALNAAPPPPPINVTSVPLSDAEAAALFADEEASLVQADAPVDPEAATDPELPQPVDDPIVEANVAEDVDPFVDEELPQVQEPEFVESEFAIDVDTTLDPGEEVFDPEQTVNANDESVFSPQDVELNSDPFEQARYEAQLEADQEAADVVLTPEELDAANDPFEQARLEAEQEANREQLAMEATDVEPGFNGQTDEFGGIDAAIEAQQAEDVDQNTDEGLGLPPGAEPDDPPTGEPFALNPDEDPGLPQDGAASPTRGLFGGAGPGDSEAATKLSAKNQATLQARYKQPSVTDWRVRLVLAQNSDYLYNALQSEGGAGILAPLKAENGVIFPYTPNITMNYQANYDQYDLTHSNYRGIFYKNSRAGDIQLRGTFTAQDTQEANYLLAVIHFFRSVTKMFYGQDAQRGTPPPLVYLLGFGDFQFSGHPCVVSTFNYNLPNEVDYIRATAPNNYGTNLLNRRTPVQSAPGGTNFSGAIRLANALLPKGAAPQIPGVGSISQNVNNTQRSTYVPTKMEIDITLIPVQTRSQISKQFSLRDFANGNLIKGGYW